MTSDQAPIELPPLSPRAPRRLIVLLHELGSDATGFAPLGLAWQLKFPGATAILLDADERTAAGRRRWFAERPLDGRAERISAAVERFHTRLSVLQRAQGVAAGRTMLVGLGQGATIAIEAVRAAASAAIVVSYAGRLARPVRPGERIDAAIHLVHGSHDTRVALACAQQAHRGLHAAGARVTLDIVHDGVHCIDQEMINLGTSRAMQSVFRDRLPVPPALDLPRLH